MWIDDITQAMMNLGGFGHYSQINSEIEKIRTDLSKNWEAVVRRTIQQHSSDSRSWLEKKDLFYSVDGIGKGVWGLRGFYPEARLSQNELNEPTNRREYKVQRVIRDTALSAQLKLYHDNTCQICGLRLRVGEDKFYSEGHHIKPLGKPHNGLDFAGNVIIVCPNCHVQCDYFEIELDQNHLESSGRKLDSGCIKYHNSRVKPSDDKP